MSFITDLIKQIDDALSTQAKATEHFQLLEAKTALLNVEHNAKQKESAEARAAVSGQNDVNTLR